MCSNCEDDREKMWRQTHKTRMNNIDRLAAKNYGLGYQNLAQLVWRKPTPPTEASCARFGICILGNIALGKIVPSYTKAAQCILCGLRMWSERPDSNRQPPAWEADLGLP